VRYHPLAKSFLGKSVLTLSRHRKG
jgi:hypothetical protein